jgi:hypothetical protein
LKNTQNTILFLKIKQKKKIYQDYKSKWWEPYFAVKRDTVFFFTIIFGNMAFTNNFLSLQENKLKERSKIMAAQVKTQVKPAKKQEDKKLSKAGEWLKNGKAMFNIVDMRAVLK